MVDSMTMPTKKATLRWSDGERERFRTNLLPDEARYYVTEDMLATYRDASRSVSPAQWTKLFEKGGYHANVVVAYGPPALALAQLERRLDKDTETFWPFDGVLATLGDAAIPLAIRSVKRAAGNIGNAIYGKQIQRALDDIAPVDAAELVEVMARVLTSKAGAKAKDKAKAWLVRHHATARPVIESALTDAKADDRKAWQAAAKVLATAGHSLVQREAKPARKPARKPASKR